MQSRLATGQLENFDAALAIDHSLDAALEIDERHGIDMLAGADRRVRVTSRTSQIARIHYLDEREAGGEFLERRLPFPVRISAEGAADGSIARATGTATVITFGVARIALGEPVETRIGADTGFGFAMRRTGAAQKYFGARPLSAPHLGWTGRVTNRAPARGALLQLLDWRAAGGRFH
jgi:hypothetical protein